MSEESWAKHDPRSLVAQSPPQEAGRHRLAFVTKETALTQGQMHSSMHHKRGDR